MSDDDGANGGGTTGERRVAGRYRLLERVGGAVWRALDERTGREVAVRQPPLPSSVASAGASSVASSVAAEERERVAHRLLHEARAAARVEHPSAVAVHDVVAEAGPGGEGGGPPWIVTEWVPGESLRDRLARGPLDVEEAARVGLAVLGALRAAHAIGIVHRDVRPANVLLAPSGRVALAGFGFEVPARGGEFEAPERGAGRGGGPASDLWSLGALLRAAMAPGDAGPLEPLLGRLLAPEPERRPGAEETAAELAAVAGETVPEPTAVVTEPTAVVAEPAAVTAEPTAAVAEPAAVIAEPAAVVAETKPGPAPERRRPAGVAALLEVLGWAKG
ncbi:serine/threonine-protein kinase [Streptomyces griseosporeus]|uniref:serine/threonine-protein kinase n=1 Tax=Streptomyces griseosporeus TaxID=1910 RepID=UPI0036FD70AE